MIRRVQREIRPILEILDEIVAARDKVIVFTSFQRMIDLAVRDLGEAVRDTVFLDRWAHAGRGPPEYRRPFSEVGGAAALLLNPRAAGTGLNIVAANHVIHYNLEWNPAVEDQASARAHRRGQQRPVTVHRLFYASTVEEIIDQRVAQNASSRRLPSSARRARRICPMSPPRCGSLLSGRLKDERTAVENQQGVERQ